MNNLTKDKLMEIYSEGKNLTDKPIIIDFYADWCGPCKTFEPTFNSVAEEYKDKVSFYKVNSEQEQEMSVMFGIRSIPTIVMISKSGEAFSNPGGMTKDGFKYYVEGLISKD
jgi:thioredoxin